MAEGAAEPVVRGCRGGSLGEGYLDVSRLLERGGVLVQVVGLLIAAALVATGDASIHRGAPVVVAAVAVAAVAACTTLGLAASLPQPLLPLVLVALFVPGLLRSDSPRVAVAAFALAAVVSSGGARRGRSGAAVTTDGGRRHRVPRRRS